MCCRRRLEKAYCIGIAQCERGPAHREGIVCGILPVSVAEQLPREGGANCVPNKDTYSTAPNIREQSEATTVQCASSLLEKDLLFHGKTVLPFSL